MSQFGKSFNHQVKHTSAAQRQQLCPVEKKFSEEKDPLFSAYKWLKITVLPRDIRWKTTLKELEQKGYLSDSGHQQFKYSRKKKKLESVLDLSFSFRATILKIHQHESNIISSCCTYCRCKNTPTYTTYIEELFCK